MSSAKILCFGNDFKDLCANLTLSQTTNFRLFQIQRFADNNLDLMKMAESSPDR